MPTHLFVYGTLRPASRQPMARRLAIQATLIGPGSAPGALYDFGAYPGAAFHPKGNGRVAGEVYALKTGGKLLRAIDAYEGCAEDGTATNYGFARLAILVTLDAGPSLMAWSYGLWEVPRPGRRVPRGDWLAHLAARTPRAAPR
jgi:gamma-glutamylcyclotransferase (GGCT)/AIG2-like uncharacterized protein YtfP